jgi:Mg-chelatase subunit ChlD
MRRAAARVAAVGVAVLVVSGGVNAWAQQKQIPPKVNAAETAMLAAPVASRLVRCVKGSDVPCLIVRLELGQQEARITTHGDTVPSHTWTARLAGTRLVGPAVRAIQETSAPFKLMVLVDLSGSMRGEGVAFVRSALRSFLTELPQTGVEVAIAPFESRRVVEQIAGARAVPPREAIAVLEALPPPDPAGNTALYSAVREGIAWVDRAVRADKGAARGGLIVVTDGRNDVSGRRDDPGLLTGEAGRRAAQQAIDASGRQLWIIGAGNVDPQELRALAGAQGEPYIIALNPILLSQSLTSIAQEISTVRELSFGLSTGSRLRLARARTLGAIRYRATGGAEVGFTRLLGWRPPLLALPAFEGSADSASLPAEVRAVVDVTKTDSSRRWMLAIFVGLIGVLLGGAVPRLAWTAPVVPVVAVPVVEGEGAAAPSGATSAASTPAAAAGAASGLEGGLRRDVHEVAPRKPDEVTGSFARVAKSP